MPRHLHRGSLQADAGDPPRRWQALFEAFSPDPRHRRGIVEIGQDSAAPDFGTPTRHLERKTD